MSKKLRNQGSQIRYCGCDQHGNLVTRCRKCKRWVTVMFGNWLVPHFPAGKCRVCPGSSQRTGDRVYTVSQVNQIEEDKRS